MDKRVIIILAGVAVLVIGIGLAYTLFLQPKIYTLTLSVLGKGQVSFQPQGGYLTAIQVQQGTSVTVMAYPDSGYKFSNWSGDLTGMQNPITLTVVKDTRIVAVFLPA